MKQVTYKEAENVCFHLGYEDMGEPLKEYTVVEGKLHETDTSCTLIGVRKNGKCGWIDASGSIIIPFEYDNYWVVCHNGIIVLEKNGKYGGLYRHNLRTAFSFNYDYLSQCYNMTFNANKNGYWGLVKPGDVMLTQFNYIGFYRNDGCRYTMFQKKELFGNISSGQIDLETGREL